MKKQLAVAVLTLAVVAISLVGNVRAQEAAPSAAEAPAAEVAVVPVDLVICLDTSNSMDGLIDSAKQKLWAIVNDLASAEPTPDLRVGLIQFGNDSLNEETGWVELVLDLTVDLDEVYSKLFALTTNGGTEYVARAATRAREGMTWSTAPNALKIIFACGNEEANQDPNITPEDACKEAISQDIIVNTIYCGDPSDDIAPGWQLVARLADGEYACIDQDSGTVVVETPMDEELAELSAQLNTTYIAYGAAREERAANQLAQDTNATAASPAAAAGRAVAKAGALYRNSMWDLVDASKEDDFDLDAVPEGELPEEMRDMSPAERATYIEEKTAERAALQERIAELGAQRDAYIQQLLEEEGLDESSALDYALRETIHKQASEKGVQFPEAPAEDTEPDEAPATDAPE